jgi:cytochrome c biogenesis protein
VGVKEDDRKRGHFIPFGLRIWRIFSSLRLALVLMLALVGLTLMGTFILQVPPTYRADLNSMTWWLQNAAQPSTGFWFPILNALGIFDVFHSFWFLAAGSLLIISIIICSLNRLKITRSYLALNPASQSEGFYKTENGPSPFFSTSTDSGNRIVTSLKKRRYTVRIEASSEDLHLVASKNRFSSLGTYLIHVSLVLFITGFLVGSYLGFNEASFLLPEGSTRDIGNNTGLSLKLNSFSDTYWPDGSPRAYRSEVTIYENKQPVKSSPIEVNHPLSYKGYRVYLSGFGPAVQIRFTRAVDGSEIYKGNVALNQIYYQRPCGGFRLVQEGFTYFFTGRMGNSGDPDFSGEQIGLKVYKTGSNMPLTTTKLDKSNPFLMENIKITYLGDASFSVFQISRDPGKSLIWTSSGLFMLGLFGVFYFPRRQVWALVQSIPGKGALLWIRADSGRRSGSSAELQALIQEAGWKPEAEKYIRFDKLKDRQYYRQTSAEKKQT